MPWTARISRTLLYSPFLFGMALQSAEPETPTGAAASSNDPLSGIRETFGNCAAVRLDEDFDKGTGNWKTGIGAPSEWTTDRLGLVAPGRLALYQPSLGLTDYQLQFLGSIEKGALSWVVRAADVHNYYVVKLTALKAGPIPKLKIRRYAVIGGTPRDGVETPLVLNERTESFYRVSMDIHADRFVLTIQDQIADSWTERRLKHGGVGFFTDRGEQSRISWLRITHQDDLLGRLCAQLAR